ncbi:MAG TPA: integration host factor, actinobacterial type [Nonomuraea sp.]|nr:integration host factor, actinobacterial type [Nonomuraea sp.]
MIYPPIADCHCLTPEQRATALEKAAEARTARSALPAGVNSGTTSVAEVFGRGGEEPVKKTRVAQVLRAVPGCGPARVAALMAVSGVAEAPGRRTDQATAGASAAGAGRLVPSSAERGPHLHG